MFLASRQATPRYGFQNSHPPAHQAHCSVLRVVVLWCLRHIVTVHFLVGHALHGALAQKWRTVYVQYKKCYVHDFFYVQCFSSGAKRIRVTFISHHDSRPRIFTSGPAILFGPCANDAVARARWQEKWCERPAQVNT